MFVSRADAEETRWPMAKEKHRPRNGISFGFYTAASRRGNVLAYWSVGGLAKLVVREAALLEYGGIGTEGDGCRRDGGGTVSSE